MEGYSRHTQADVDARAGQKSMVEVHAEAQKSAMQEACLNALRRAMPSASAETCLMGRVGGVRLLTCTIPAVIDWMCFWPYALLGCGLKPLPGVHSIGCVESHWPSSIGCVFDAR
jgi:hypothetical protein